MDNKNLPVEATGQEAITTLKKDVSPKRTLRLIWTQQAKQDAEKELKEILAPWKV